MRMGNVLLLALAACGGATNSGLFGSDVDDAASDAAADATTSSSSSSPGTDAGAPPDAKAPPATTADAMIPSGSRDAGAPAPPSDDCPETPDYAYEFSERALDAPLCGQAHGDCTNPTNDCCYYDHTSNAHVCLPWLRDQ
jgi:hypothetical protein